MWQCMQMEVSLQFAVLEWVNKRQDLDTCTLEIKEHKSDVKDVVCLPGDELLASACSDGKINLCESSQTQNAGTHGWRISSRKIKAAKSTSAPARKPDHFWRQK